MNVAISTNGYDAKPNTSLIPKIEFQNQDVNLFQLKEAVMNGHVISAVFRSKNIKFTQTQRKMDNIVGIQFVMIDIDESLCINIDKLIESLVILPTMAYTTYSHKVKGNRYRLLYIFNDIITNVDIYKQLYDKIVEKNKLKCDPCGSNPAQMIFGTNGQMAEIRTFPNTYNLIDFDIKYKLTIDASKPKKKSNTKISIDINNDFFDDFMHLSFGEFIDIYRTVYPHIQHTPFERDNSKPYTILPDNFIYIRHKYCDEVYNGDVVGTNIVKLKDGQRRRKALYMCAIMRRLMIPDITIEHLLANAYYDLNYYISNAIDPINRYELTEICVRAYTTDISKYNIDTFKDKKQPKFIINDDYCAQNGITKKKALSLARKLLNYERIGEVYDPSLSLNENIKQMNELGVKVSKPTLIKFKKYLQIS